MGNDRRGDCAGRAKQCRYREDGNWLYWVSKLWYPIPQRCCLFNHVVLIANRPGSRYSYVDQHKISYIASDRRHYGLDIQTDRGLSQVFHGNTDTIKLGSTGARFVKIAFLLNSKAYSYLTRDTATNKAKDGRDIVFILDYMLRKRIRPCREECRWVVDCRFWTDFVGFYPGQEAKLTAIGLQRDPTPANSTTSSARAVLSSQSSGSDSTVSSWSAGAALRIGGGHGR
jgi:hypothetical protein